MSDDEEYYEFEEDFMYEDLVPDMVVSSNSITMRVFTNTTAQTNTNHPDTNPSSQDDLAASSYYEAALYEDPGIDVEDYFSDWDYYSDDYYDDDRTAEQSAERKKRTEIAASAKRRTKGTTLKPTTTIPTKSPLSPDLASFQGVVWKTPALDRDQDVAILYEPDTGEKVALLENWREIFKFSQPALDKSRLRRRHVEESKHVDVLEADNEMSDEDDELDSSDEMSDGGSLADASGSGVDAGDASNTTPDPDPEPPRQWKLASPPQVVIHVPANRSRKRKAVAQEEEPGEDTAPPRSKKVESRKGGGARGNSDAPVRRSARQKK
jgi:hypothetical protein